ncbi:hypothetical protein K438DRAFT_2020077 [Mycena galopus ATCC 62051]|nr:hypothetical protein K438DRAFT_2020077 [Mycena galopus ATCC 62051]
MRFVPVVTKDILCQILEGVAFIHSMGMAHGDLQPANFGVAIPEINCLRPPRDLLHHLWGPPSIRLLLPVPSDRDRTPPYKCDTMDLGHVLFLHSASVLAPVPRSVRIFDLGSAHVRDGSPTPKCEILTFYGAPEVVFPRVTLKKDGSWDHRSDIWSLAIAFHDLVGAKENSPMFNPEALPRCMASLCGAVPEAWRDCIASSEFPTGWSLERTAEL